MPDDIQRTIYRLELDDSGYIRGVESMSESTKKLVDVQNNANKQLQTNESALKANSDLLAKAKKDLDAYTGANEDHRKQLEKTYKDAQANNVALTQAVDFSRKIYEKATKAALDFADSTVKANSLQSQPGAKIPTQIPLGIQSNVVSDITNIIKSGDLSGLPEVLAASAAEFEKLRSAITAAEEKMLTLNQASQEFIALQEFVAASKDAIAAYDNAVKLAAESTVELGERVKAAQAEVERISAVSPKELPAEVAKSKVQFDELAASVAGASDRLATLDEGSDEFKQLEQVVLAGRAALDQYNEAAGRAGIVTKTYRAELAEANLELKRLQESGTATTEQVIEQEKVVARLTNAYETQQARIKVLASDTRALDFGKAAIQGAIQGFQVYTSLSILAGDSSEELQKKTLQLFAAMQLLTALEQLSTTVKKGSILATNLQSASMTIYKVAVDASSSALGKLKLALAATGIGLAIIAVSAIVNKFKQLGEETGEAARKQKLLNDVVKETAGDYVRAYTEVSKLKDQFALASQGIGSQRDALIEYNKTLGPTVGFVTSFKEAEEGLVKNASAYIRITQLKAEANLLLAKSAEANLKLDQALALTIDPNLPAFQRDALKKLKAQLVKDAETEVKDVTELFTKVTNRVQDETKKAVGKTTQQLLADALPKKGSIDAAKKVIEDQIADLKVSFGKLDEANESGRKKNLAQQEKLQKDLDKLTGKKPSGRKVDNTFEEERLKLIADLSEIRRTEIDDIKKINDAFADKLAVERKRIEGLIKDKKVTGTIADSKSQAGILFNLAVDVNKAELDKALADFNKKITDAREKLNTELAALQLQADRESILLNIAAIQDDFDKRAALIDFNEKKEIEDARLASERRLEALELNRLLIGEEAYQEARFKIIETGEQNVLNLTRKFAEERNALAEDKFFEFLTFIDDAVDNINLEIDEALAKEIQGQSDKFVAGKISFEQYQKEISEIQRRQENIRRDRTLFLHKVQIEDLQVQLDAIDDTTSKKYIRLQEKLKKLRERYAKEQQANAQGDAADTQAEDEIEAARLAKIRDVATAIGEVTNSIVGFWQAANAAEAEALDRSISLQEKRVEAAQRIAERGNAQYLKAETDRLKELQVARENAARRELAINAALQASQLLVGITGAITKIANPVSGTAEVIGAIAVIFAALATGYGLVKSLQGNQPQFKEGTKQVRRERGERAGTDTVQAWLTEGEAVIPARVNREYHPAVEAIYDQAIPADVLNNFVKNYSLSVKPIPQVNYERIGRAAEVKITTDSRLAGLLQEQTAVMKENNQLQRDVKGMLKKIGVNVSLDQYGFAVTQMEVIDQMKKDKKL